MAACPVTPCPVTACPATEIGAPPAGSRSVSDQRAAPLAEAAQRFHASADATFTTPGHKRAPWLVDPLLALDLPLAPGVDDAQLSGDYLAAAERLAAELWQADYCRFSVNGSTHGNEAFALAVAEPGARVAVSRNLHKSLLSGLILAGLKPVWLYPDVDPLSGLAAGVELEQIKRALELKVEAVMLVEPSYVGVISDLEAIVAVSHAAGVPVLADQAWGSHLGLLPELPAGAIRAGADAMVISAHKTLAAFTQSAIVLAQGDLLDRERLDAAFELLNTTSPSAAIAASIDRARQIMALQGEQLLGQTLALARHFHDQLSDVDGLYLLDERITERCPATHSFDPLKLVLLLAGTGATGFEVERDLLAAGIRVEVADRDVLVALLTIGDDRETVDRLIAALRDSIERRRGEPRPVGDSTLWGLRPETRMTPRDAFFARRRRVDARDAIGRVCAETAAPYPPGIPVLAPGELVTGRILELLQGAVAAGSRVAYCSDPTLETLLVVE